MNETGSIWNLTLADFRAATASTQPTPGGGSVACVSGALGLGLIIMALEISASRKGAVWPPEAVELLSTARRALEALSADADADIAAFQAYMDSLKLPKATDDDKRARAQAMQDATRRATEAPLAAAQRIVDALRLGERAVTFTHAHVVSDVGAGVALLEGALKAVLGNVDVNLPRVTDAALQAEWSAPRVSLLKDGCELAADVLKAVSRKVASRDKLINGTKLLQHVSAQSRALRKDFAGKVVVLIAFQQHDSWDAARYRAYLISEQEKVRALTAAGFEVRSHFLPPELSLQEFDSLLAHLEGDAGVLASSVQMPVPPGLEPALARLREKDVDAVAPGTASVCAVAEAALRLVAPWREGGVAVVGAKGFVGRAVCRALAAEGCDFLPLDFGDDLGRVRAMTNVIAAASAPEILDARHLDPRHEMVVDIGFSLMGRELKTSVGNVSRGAYAIPKRLTETPGGTGPLAMTVLIERLVKLATGTDLQRWSYPFPKKPADVSPRQPSS